MSQQPNILIWNEFRHEKLEDTIRKVYPDGIHTAITAGLRQLGLKNIHTATLDEPEHGLTEETLAKTDVLFWWGHMAHGEVQDEIAARVARRVLDGMGLVVLHSGHMSKPFLRLMGTSGALKWREIGERERLWVVNPSHPIAAGLEECIILEHEEMYGEFFDVPAPDELVFISWFQGGEVFRSGCCYRRGLGKVFYFRPGHESFPTYYDPQILRVLYNSALWAATLDAPKVTYWHIPEPPEKIQPA